MARKIVSFFAPELRPSQRRGRIVLLHGLGRSRASMWLLEWRLRRGGWSVRRIGYPSRRLSLDAAAMHVRAAIVEDAADRLPIAVVGHSLGGVIALRLKRDAPELRIGSIVQLGAPNRGSPVADLLSDWRVGRAVLGPVIGQLGRDPGGSWTRDPRVLAIAGIGWPAAFGRLYGIYGASDLLLGLRSAWGRKSGFRAAIPCLHLWLPFSSRAAQLVNGFLDERFPDRSESGGSAPHPRRYRHGPYRLRDVAARGRRAAADDLPE